MTASSGRARLVVANWKMNLTPTEAAAFGADLLSKEPAPPAGVRAGIAPAYPALERLGRFLAPTPYLLVAQDVHAEEKGAFTGGVSAAMLADLGVSMAIVGHSERRVQRRESEADFSKKMNRLVAHGIAPLYCVGETLSQRESGETESVLRAQLAALDEFPSEPPPGLALAYEPVWAIGTGRAASPALAAETHRMLRAMLGERYSVSVAGDMPILYGGSVTPEGSAALFQEPEIDGALVGNASLKAPSFLSLLQAAAAAG
jgi:triosephosphate isomerase